MHYILSLLKPYNRVLQELCFPIWRSQRVMSWRHRGFTWKPLSSLTLRENPNEIGQWILHTWATPRAYGYKRVTGVPLRGWRTRALSSVSGPPTRWRCVCGWLMRLLWAYEHYCAAISPFLSERIATSTTTRAGLSGSSRGPPDGALWDLRVTVRASTPGTSSLTSYSSRSERPFRFPGDFAGSSHGAPSI